MSRLLSLLLLLFAVGAPLALTACQGQDRPAVQPQDDDMDDMGEEEDAGV